MNTKHNKGFTLLELMIACAIIAILSAIAWPIYQNYVTKSNRVAATTCMMEYSQFMERFYTMNMSYEETRDGDDITLPDIECANNLSRFYEFSLASVDDDSYTLRASPINEQERRDSDCGSLSLDETGKRGVGGDESISKCWNG